MVYGHWIVFTYGENGESFNWTDPAWQGGLLSARHGLFYWHPFLLAGLAGLGILVWRRGAMAMAGAVAVALTIYVNAAWGCWWFAASFGQRAFDGACLFAMLGFAFLLMCLPARAARVCRWLGGAATAWNFYLMAIFYTTAIPRDDPVTWLQMLRKPGPNAARSSPRFLASETMKACRQASENGFSPGSVAVVALLLAVGEEFPFSRFPMYATFDPVADYYYLADAGGRPLACLPVFGTSTAKLKKMYRSRVECAHRRPWGRAEADATPAERQQAGVELIEFVRASAIERGRAPQAGAVRLMRVEVRGPPEEDSTGGRKSVAEQA